MNKPVLSFDFWGTLVTANPLFKQAKLALFQVFLNSPIGASDLEQDSAHLKKHYNELVDQFGIQPDIRMLFADLVHEYSQILFSISQLDTLIADYQTLASQYPPIVIPGTVDVLEQLAETHTLVLSSNTLFVQGTTLSRFIRQGLTGLFSELNFSDQVGFSKPDETMFRFRCDRPVLHVGDNPVTDGASVKYNIPFYQINSNLNTIQDVPDYLRSSPDHAAGPDGPF